MADLRIDHCHVVRETSNEDFLQIRGLEGRVGLIGGSSWTHTGVRLGQALLPEFGRPSLWSHAVIFNDGGRLWESDFMVEWREIRLFNGAQENPICKYFDEKKYPYLAILDFGLSGEQTHKILQECQKMMDEKVLYPVSGLIGTGLAYLSGMETRRNAWCIRNALYCSAFVQRAYETIGKNLCESVHMTNTSPEHIWRTQLAHDTFIREKEKRELVRIRRKIM